MTSRYQRQREREIPGTVRIWDFSPKDSRDLLRVLSRGVKQRLANYGPRAKSTSHRLLYGRHTKNSFYIFK